MTRTSSLRLPYISPAQAQKHITHNEALRLLDCIIHAKVLATDLNVPPASPNAGDKYLIGPAPSGDWADNAGDLVSFEDGFWQFITPLEGWVVWSSPDAQLLVFNGLSWIPASVDQNADSLEQLAQLGINTQADSYNRLAVKSEGILLSHPDDGSGNIYLTVNKSSSANTGSVLFQDSFTGHAELGLVGSNDFSLRVSETGESWQSAMVVNTKTGEVDFPLTTNLGGSGVSGAPLFVDMPEDIRTQPSLSMRGTARDSSSDTEEGVGLYLTHNSPNNRQFALLSTDDRIGLRVSCASQPGIDGYANGRRSDLQIGSNTNGAHVGFSISKTQFSVNNLAGDGAKIVLEVVGANNQSADLLAVGTDISSRGDSLRVDSNRHTHFGGAVTLKAHLKNAMPSNIEAGAMIFVSDEIGGAVPAFYDGADWRRITDRAVVS